MFNLYPTPFLVSVAARKKANYYCFANLVSLNKKKKIIISLCSQRNFFCFSVCFVSSDNEGVKASDACAASHLKRGWEEDDLFYFFLRVDAHAFCYDTAVIQMTKGFKASTL